MDRGGLTITLFGPTADIRWGSAPIKARSKKGLWLLALLALQANRPLSREWIAGALWPDSETARETLRRTLTDLRAALGPCADRLDATNQTLCLHVSEVDVDVLRFDALARRDDLECLEQAIALYRGPLLENCDESWAVFERTRRAQTYLQTLERVALAYRDRNDAGQAIRCMRLAIVADPLRESAHRDLMRILAENGEASEAILAFRRLRLLLRHETQSEPSHETVALYQQIRAKAAASPRSRTSSPPERAAIPQTLPLPDDAGTAAPPSNLPYPLTALLGRQKELREVSDSLTQSRLVTLAGAGGIGKTRLAIETATQLQGDFPDGVWFIELAPIGDPGLIAATVASALDIREEPGRELRESMTEKLGLSRQLLVLDNCEHLLEGCADFARNLVERCPGIHILATSRRSLRLTGELVLRLEPLNVPEPISSRKEPDIDVAEWLERSAALQLFVERADAVQSSFSLSLRNLGPAIEICRQLDGIPLALELAAARATTLSVELIASLLQDRFRLLTVGDRAARPRQQSLRALVDWSYDLLDARERVLFARLAVFAGGWTLDAAVAVCGSPDPADAALARWDVLEMLDSLVESSLVLTDQDSSGVTRYRMLETIREYASEKLREMDGVEEGRIRHGRWFLEFAEIANSKPIGEPYTRALRELERDHDNLRQALQEVGPGLDRMRLAGALAFFWYIQGHLTEGRVWLERVLAETPDAPAKLRGKILGGIGKLCWVEGDLQQAREMHMRNLEIQRTEGDRPGVGHTLNNLGLISFHQGDCWAAIDLYHQSIALLRETDEAQEIGSVLGNLGIALKNVGEYEQATKALREAEALSRRIGDLRALGQALQMLGTLAVRNGDYAAARACITESLDMDRAAGNIQGIAASEHVLGDLALAEGDFEGAAVHFQEALDVFWRLGSKRSIAAGLASLGDVAFQCGKYAEAQAYHRDSLRIELELGNRLGMSDSLLSVALIDAREGRGESAVRLLAVVQEDARRTDIPLPPHRHDELTVALASVRETLGEEAVAAIWEEGTALDLQDAVVGWLRAADT